MIAPLYYKRKIPFYIDKQERAIARDIYEKYHPIIVKQLQKHYGGEEYIFQKSIEFITNEIVGDVKHLCELGCGTGRMLSHLATKYKDKHFVGLDYSFQMIKHATDIWIAGKDVCVDYSDRGFAPFTVAGQKIPNIQFGVASAEQLPFDSSSMDLLYSHFLIDRISDISTFIDEAKRVLKSNSKLVIISPFNFQKRKDWNTYFEVEHFVLAVCKRGFEITRKSNYKVEEVLDGNGNKIQWNCHAMTFHKK